MALASSLSASTILFLLLYAIAGGNLWTRMKKFKISYSDPLFLSRLFLVSQVYGVLHRVRLKAVSFILLKHLALCTKHQISL